MLKKLRIKFILINMAIVTIMLGVIFGLLYYSTSRNLERESLQMMERLSMNPRQIFPPNKPQDGQDDIMLPYFTIIVGRDGRIIEVGGGFFDLSDELLVRKLLDKTRASEEKVGILREYHLRYTKFETPIGESIVFADMTSEQSTLRNLIKTFVLIGSASYVVFLGISILLARWAVKPVDIAWKQQKQFVADASHELKTPLTVIMTNAELMQSESCQPEERIQYESNILTMSRQMRGLVESMLELARVDNDSQRKNHVSVLLSDSVYDEAMVFEPVFFEKELPFRYEIEPLVRVSGNNTQLKQLIDILLDNASKYASPGGETIMRLKTVSHKRCLLEVSNQGPQISSEDLPNLFKRFYRADKVRTMNHSYGLGLSIAQKISEEHRGIITAKSENGYNTFSVELPME